MDIYNAFIKERIKEPTKEVFLDKCIEIYLHLKKHGYTINENDIYIAAWCILCGCILVTNNIKHYENIPELYLEDWR